MRATNGSCVASSTETKTLDARTGTAEIRESKRRDTVGMDKSEHAILFDESPSELTVRDDDG